MENIEDFKKMFKTYKEREVILNDNKKILSNTSYVNFFEKLISKIGIWLIFMLVYVIIIPEIIITLSEVSLNILLLIIGPDLINKNYINSFDEVKDFFNYFSNMYRLVNALICGKNLSNLFEKYEKEEQEDIKLQKNELEKINKEIKNLKVDYYNLQKKLENELLNEKSKDVVDLLNELKIYLNNQKNNANINEPNELENYNDNNQTKVKKKGE